MPSRILKSLVGSHSARLCDECQKRAKLRSQKPSLTVVSCKPPDASA
jgi:hypothetical protein